MKYITYAKDIISNILSALFPHKDPVFRLSPFIPESQTWLDKIMQDTQIVDYLWNSSNME